MIIVIVVLLLCFYCASIATRDSPAAFAILFLSLIRDAGAVESHLFAAAEEALDRAVDSSPLYFASFNLPATASGSPPSARFNGRMAWYGYTQQTCLSARTCVCVCGHPICYPDPFQHAARGRRSGVTDCAQLIMIACSC